MTATALNDTGPLESVTRLEETRMIAPTPNGDVLAVEVALKIDTISEIVIIDVGVPVERKSDCCDELGGRIGGPSDWTETVLDDSEARV